MGLALSEEQAKTLLEEYDLLGETSHGGQKYVFKCLRNDELCAAKVICLPDDIVLNAPEEEVAEAWSAILRRSQREFDSMSICNCKNLVKVIDGSYFVSSVGNVGAIVFAEEWVNGCTLERIKSSSPLMRENDLLKLALDVASAIKELDRHGLVHRDIKPSNIIFSSETNRYILLDLGLALDLKDEGITRTGFTVGTLPYLAPEQMNPKYKPEMTFKVDLFALGTVLYELATGKRPYFKYMYTIDQLYKSIMEGPRPESPSIVNAGISEEFSKIIMRLLAKMPNARFRKPQHLIEALEQIGG